MMLLRKIIIFHIIFFCIYGPVSAQKNPDTTDVTLLYKKIEKFSEKRKITSLIHGLILKPLTLASSQPPVISGHRENELFKMYEGKIIRQINISTLDPFGFSVYDTLAKPGGYIERSGNTLHVKTQHLVVRNRLLFRKYDNFDSLLVKESERLVRSLSYIQDVRVTAALAGINSDSVDISIRVMDLWSIVADGSLSNSHLNFKLSDKNLTGFGHTFSNSFTQNFKEGSNAFSTSYYIPNIKNTYISARLDYILEETKNYQKGINLERPFFSPIARWAAGIHVSQQKQPGWINKNDTTRLFLNSKFNIQDYWAAAAWQIFKGKSITDRTTKLIISGRIFNIRYLEKPLEQPEILDYYTNENMLMTGLGISSRKYIQQSYIFRFGKPEDVPVGLAYGLVVGYQVKNHERWYWGIQHSWGNFFKWGYFGTRIEYGTFVNASFRTEGVFAASINYFSGLFTIGKWNFRQFARPELTIGIKRPNYDRLTLNDGYGLNGFNSNVLSGSMRFLFLIQTQSYAPWNLLGFRFGPYLNFAFGMLGDDEAGFGHSRVYPQFGFGILIRNDYLVIKNFQLSIAFYPTIPGNGNNVFKANPFRTTDFGFPDFILGKPGVTEFR